MCSSIHYCHLWYGPDRYQLVTLDTTEQKAMTLISSESLVSKLQNLDQGFLAEKQGYLIQIRYISECVQELVNLVPPSPFSFGQLKTPKHFIFVS